jgi:hypothetical protein
MDADRFDTLTRSLTAGGSRRRAMAAGLGSALSLLGLAHSDETGAKSGKCKPACGECAKCDKGRCQKKNGTKRCKKGKCKPKADGTACMHMSVCWPTRGLCERSRLLHEYDWHRLRQNRRLQT